MRLNMEEPLYLVRGEAPRYPGDIELSTISGDGDYLANDPRDLDGVFRFDPDDWEDNEEIVDQKTYDDWLAEIHVSPADGELKQDRFGNWWYNQDGTWHLVDEGDGSLNFQRDIDGPDDLENWEPGNYQSYRNWYEQRHPSWKSHPDYQAISAAYKSAQAFVSAGTAALMGSRDWSIANPDVDVDLTPRVLASGVELVALNVALERGIVRFVSHGSVPVLEVLHYDSGRPQWRGVHAFTGAGKFSNVSASRLPYGYDNPENPICQPPNDISDWYVGYVYNSNSRWTPGYGSHVVWTLSPLGLDSTSGGQTDCTLEEGAYLVGAIRETVVMKS